MKTITFYRRWTFLVLIASFLCLKPGWAAEGLATSFVGTVLREVPLGVTQEIIYKDRHGITVHNLGDMPLMVTISVLVPSPDQLRKGAQPIPDTHWIVVSPTQFSLEGHASRTVGAWIKVPAERPYRQKHFQAMVWIRGAPADANGITLAAGLLTRLRIKTARR